jgi:ubiquitin-protein ligase
MSLRLRRLANEEQMLREQFAGHPYVSVRPTGGDPPDRYRVEYRVGGLERRSDGTLVVRKVHEMEIVLPAEYPRQPAACRMLTPIFHPNIDSFTVCTSDFHAAQETLCDLIVRVGQMIAFQKHNVKSPLNAEAAIWCEQNLARFPVDRTDIYPTAIAGTGATGSPGAVWPASVGVAGGARTPPPPPPPFFQHTASDDVDAVTVKLISPFDSTVSPEGVAAPVGSIVKLGVVRCMIAMQHDPPRIEVRNMDGRDVVEISTATACSVEFSGALLRIVGADRTSLARLGREKLTWSPRDPAVATFWNSVLQTQVTLSSRAQRLVESTGRADPAFARNQELARKKVEHSEWLVANSPAGSRAKLLLGDAIRRLREAIERGGAAT